MCVCVFVLVPGYGDLLKLNIEREGGRTDGIINGVRGVFRSDVRSRCMDGG